MLRSNARFWGVLCGLSSLLGFGATAQAAGAELPVCVEVEIQRPGAKKPAEKAADKPVENTADKPTDPAADARGKASPEALRALAALRAAADTATLTDLDPEGTQDPRVKSGGHLPLGQTPEGYLKRLIEHYVTHERGFVAVPQGCSQKIVVELYPLRLGWTAFARYSGTGREERVDQLLPTELSQFAERSVLALLRDVSINETVDRGNVLWADSLKATQNIRGRSHVVLGLGTRLRVGRFDTVVKDASDGTVGGTRQELRPFTPMLMTVAYRGQFEEFGVEAGGELDLGTSLSAARSNPGGGHIDYGGSVGAVLHAFRYTDVRGLTSLYYGGGATFALHWFNAIRPETDRASGSRATLVSGGLDIDAVLGYEFMRASAVSFFLQSELNLPAYLVKNENSSGSMNTWFPGAALKLGAVF